MVNRLQMDPMIADQYQLILLYISLVLLYISLGKNTKSNQVSEHRQPGKYSELQPKSEIV